LCVAHQCTPLLVKAPYSGRQQFGITSLIAGLISVPHPYGWMIFLILVARQHHAGPADATEKNPLTCNGHVFSIYGGHRKWGFFDRITNLIRPLAFIFYPDNKFSY
jgi:hypothetical protein